MRYNDEDSCNPSEVERMSPINEKMESVDSGMRRIRELVTTLSGSIEPILLPTCGTVGCGDDQKSCDGSPLANWMSGVNDELKSIARKIESIISRVEV